VDSLPDGAGHEEVALGHIGDHVSGTRVQQGCVLFSIPDGDGAGSRIVDSQQQF
jgi:hypothetical protein